MSHLGYFKAAINNWYKLEKKTPTRINEMKEILRQFDYSKWCKDFENEDKQEVNYLELKMKEIYKELY